ncbi:MAG: T9SS type A sorting domain-containing protein, partial [Ignavibacteria bacterium]
YPNPFNPTTKIKFQIPLNKGGERGLSFVTLKIYDLLGREVATLVNQQLKPGTYEVEFNGTNYPSGVYFYRLTTNNNTATKKFVLVK